MLKYSLYSILLFLIENIIHIVITYKLYEKYGIENNWKIFLPLYNIFILLKITNQPIWLIIFFFFPKSSFILYFFSWKKLISMFGKNKIKHDIIFFLTFGIVYTFFLNYSNNIKRIYEKKKVQTIQNYYFLYYFLYLYILI